MPCHGGLFPFFEMKIENTYVATASHSTSLASNSLTSLTFEAPVLKATPFSSKANARTRVRIQD